MLLTCRLLELWQKRGSGLLGSSLALHTSSGRSDLRDSPRAGIAALQAMIKVIAAEAPGTAFSGFDRDTIAPHAPDNTPQVVLSLFKS